MSFNPIKKDRASKIVIEQIKNAVQKGEFSPGDKLPPERDLAKQFSLSRGVVREAISVLESKGVVEVKPGIGVFLVTNEQEEVFQLLNALLENEDSSLIELLELRQSIESQAAYYAAERRSKKELDKIKAALDKLESCFEKGRVAAEEDFEFHMAVAEASHNSMMVHTLRLISDYIINGLYESRTDALMIPGQDEIAMDEHKRIYAAIKDMDPVRAHKEMITHLENVKKYRSVLNRKR
ncbi:FadR/GntR family transcriptional regulator [Metabacillus sediminilitoris]|uniref:FadR family transcriptional regulator n=1 Tax=Metabacillus sediminilitoris TaxID=2567941 RepID=A0A4S4BXQ6_9BACI|nr:FadR/GntR family transcriptional regulator [Metabacillus sediminilitoris]QGQ44380.1 FCD domain-containing protein [Metabacillus sediminilitoris]THF80004.1 FadR family transcriptional regulator [Metabacillus sediminilitoris]